MSRALSQEEFTEHALRCIMALPCICPEDTDPSAGDVQLSTCASCIAEDALWCDPDQDFVWWDNAWNARSNGRSEESCKICGKRIEIMCQYGTGYCGQFCAKDDGAIT